ncbi:MAG: hypothetical protein KQH63_22020 [Desulfobulbaceae bacterium]|nr:hypothetical protein [Desulfobulbaceae bacterium]
MKKITCCLFLILSLLIYCGDVFAVEKSKKILWVDSYHKGYVWSDEIGQSIRESLKGRDVEFVETHMHTKLNRSEEFKREAGLKIKRLIEEIKPDVVIASDDNAAKYVIVPYFMDNVLPFVFCGINWDASRYGFPTRNVTGMVEVVQVQKLVEELQKHAKGKRIGFLGLDSITDRKEAEFFRSEIDQVIRVAYVKTFEEWKREFVKMQDEVDCLRITLNIRGATDWNVEEARKFVMENTKIPTGAATLPMAPYALVTFTKVPSEQGEWAAKAALQILDGRSPTQIQVVKNKNTRVYLNMPLAKKMGVKFSMDLIDRAHFVGEEILQ